MRKKVKTLYEFFNPVNPSILAWWLLDYFLTAIVIARLSGIQWALMCLLMDKAGK